MKYNYNELIGWLQENVVTISVKNVNGTVRTSRCTLVQHYLPEDFRGKAPMLTETTPIIISVWNVDMGVWQSIPVENVVNAFVE
jgi:hypothetical protein